MPSPVDDQELLIDLESLPSGSLSPEFEASVELFSNFIFKNALTKEIEGVPLDGSSLSLFIESYVDGINFQTVINVRSTFEIVVKSQVLFHCLSCQTLQVTFFNRGRFWVGCCHI